MAAHEGRVAIVTGAGSGIGAATVDRDKSSRNRTDQLTILRGDVSGEDVNEAAVAAAVENHGAIAVAASTSALAGDPEMWAYNSSKAAVVNLVRSAALDLGPRGIRVNAVAPGPTETAMTERIQQAPEVYTDLRRRMALQRWAHPEEIAAVLAFLVSSDASIVTGAVIAADGGMTANTGQFLPKESP